MHHEIPELDAKGLRGFALKMAVVIAILFGLFLPWLFEFGYPVWPWAVAAILILWGLVAPASMRGLYRGWMRVGIAIGTFNSKVILGLVFFTIVAPAGFLMRMFRKDPMARDLENSASTYRVPSRTAPHDHLEKPY